MKVQLWISKDSPAIREALQKAGFTLSLDHSTARTLAGEVPIDNLLLLAQMAEVKFISVTRK